MVGIIIAVALGWAGGYRFYKKQIGLGVLYLFTCGLFGIGWIIDIVKAVNEYKRPAAVSHAPSKTLRTYRVKQAPLSEGFEKLNTSTNYDPIQEGIKTLRKPNPKYKEGSKAHPYIIDIGSDDLVFKEIEYRAVDGLECFQVFARNHHICTIFDEDTSPNRRYMQAMIQGKVDGVYIKFKPQLVTDGVNTDYNYKADLFMHMEDI